MEIGRKICLALSIGVILLWLSRWFPEYLPQPLYSFLQVFGSMLTVLLFPAFVGVWLCTKRRLIANNVAALLACAFGALQAYGFFAGYCAWGCPMDAFVYSVTAVFLAAILGALYFFVRVVLLLFNAWKANISGMEVNSNAL
jgi:hypothetical protein